MKTNEAVADPICSPAAVPCAPQVQSNSNLVPAPSVAPAATTVGQGEGLPATPEAGVPKPGRPAQEEWPRPQPARRERKKQQEDLRERGRNWLKNEPQSWVDRRIRNRANAAVYIVRQVFKNQRVQLERNWMSYMSDVDTIRTKFEPYN